MAAERLRVDREKLRRARILKGYSQGQLAKKARVAEQSIRNLFVTGFSGLSVTLAVVKALGLRMEDVVIFEEPASAESVEASRIAV